MTNFGGTYFFHEFLQVLQVRDFLAPHLAYPRCNHRYSLSQMILALIYPIVLGLDCLETASFLRFNGKATCRARNTHRQSSSNPYDHRRFVNFVVPDASEPYLTKS